MSVMTPVIARHCGRHVSRISWPQMNSSSAVVPLRPKTRPPPMPEIPDPAGALRLALDLAEIAIELAEDQRRAPRKVARIKLLILELRGR